MIEPAESMSCYDSNPETRNGMDTPLRVVLKEFMAGVERELNDPELREFYIEQFCALYDHVTQFKPATMLCLARTAVMIAWTWQGAEDGLRNAGALQDSEALTPVQIVAINRRWGEDWRPSKEAAVRARQSYGITPKDRVLVIDEHSSRYVRGYEDNGDTSVVCAEKIIGDTFDLDPANTDVYVLIADDYGGFIPAFYGHGDRDAITQAKELLYGVRYSSDHSDIAPELTSAPDGEFIDDLKERYRQAFTALGHEVADRILSRQSADTLL